MHCSNGPVPESGAYVNPGQQLGAVYDAIWNASGEQVPGCSSFQTTAARSTAGPPVYAAVKKDKTEKKKKKKKKKDQLGGDGHCYANLPGAQATQDSDQQVSIYTGWSDVT